jgi:hypothetical protein
MGQEVSENVGAEQYAGDNFSYYPGLAELTERISQEMGKRHYEQ